MEAKNAVIFSYVFIYKTFFSCFSVKYLCNSKLIIMEPKNAIERRQRTKKVGMKRKQLKSKPKDRGKSKRLNLKERTERSPPPLPKKSKKRYFLSPTDTTPLLSLPSRLLRYRISGLAPAQTCEDLEDGGLLPGLSMPSFPAFSLAAPSRKFLPSTVLGYLSSLPPKSNNNERLQGVPAAHSQGVRAEEEPSRSRQVEGQCH